MHSFFTKNYFQSAETVHKKVQNLKTPQYQDFLKTKSSVCSILIFELLCITCRKNVIIFNRQVCRSNSFKHINSLYTNVLIYLCKSV